MASDAQMTQSQTYWSSASPIAMSEFAASYSPGWAASIFSMKIRNAGTYPIKVTKMLGGSGCWGNGTIYYAPYKIDYYLGAGEEAVIGDSRLGGTFKYSVPAVQPDSPGTSNCNGGSGFYLYAAKSTCQNSNSTPGTLQMNNFGFEYIIYIDGQQVTKRQVGSEPLLIKCREPSW